MRHNFKIHSKFKQIREASEVGKVESLFKDAKTILVLRISSRMTACLNFNKTSLLTNNNCCCVKTSDQQNTNAMENMYFFSNKLYDNYYLKQI